MTFFEELNSHFNLVQYLELILRIVVAAVCGGIVGVERSRRFKNAGVRTHCIVACTAAIIMIISKYGFADLTTMAGTNFPGSRGADPARLAAQIVSGISFLGAGIIYRDRHGSAKGLTTAAGIWAVAGIGMAMGSGLYVIGLFATLFLVIIQAVMHRFAIGSDRFTGAEMKIVIEDNEDAVKRMYKTLADWGIAIMESSVSREEGILNFDLTVKLPKNDLDDEIGNYLSQERSIKSINLTDSH